MRELTKTNFDKIIEENNIVVVDFWAKWCQPCLAFAEIYERVAADFPDVLFSKVNVEVEEELAQEFGIMSIPTLMVVKQRVVIYSESGTLPEAVLRDLIEQAVKVDIEGA